MGSSKEEVLVSVRSVRELLESLGFVVSMEKSVFVPTQVLEYIGLIISTMPMTFSLTEKKILDIRKLCGQALEKQHMSLRDLATVIGNLNWATPNSSLRSGSLQSSSDAIHSGFKESLPLSPGAKDDLAGWLSKADFSSGKSIRRLLHQYLSLRTHLSRVGGSLSRDQDGRTLHSREGRKPH